MSENETETGSLAEKRPRKPRAANKPRGDAADASAPAPPAAERAPEARVERALAAVFIGDWHSGFGRGLQAIALLWRPMIFRCALCHRRNRCARRGASGFAAGFVGSTRLARTFLGKAAGFNFVFGHRVPRECE